MFGRFFPFSSLHLKWKHIVTSFVCVWRVADVGSSSTYCSGQPPIHISELDAAVRFRSGSGSRTIRSYSVGFPWFLWSTLKIPWAFLHDSFRQLWPKLWRGKVCRHDDFRELARGSEVEDGDFRRCMYACVLCVEEAWLEFFEHWNSHKDNYKWALYWKFNNCLNLDTKEFNNYVLKYWMKCWIPREFSISLIVEVYTNIQIITLWNAINQFVVTEFIFF